MKLPKSWMKVTPFSKVLALTLFVTLPFLMFLLGIKYGINLSSSTSVPQSVINNTLVSQPTATIEVQSSSSPTQIPIAQGANLEDIKYTLPSGWTGGIVNNVGPNGNERAISINAPRSSGGNL